MARRTTTTDLTALDLTAADLILTRKGRRPWTALLARRPRDPQTGRPYGPDRDRLEQMARKPMKELPKPKTMEGLAVMLEVTTATVLDACARSVRYEVRRSRGRFELLIPPGVEDLDPDVQDMFLDQLRLAVRMNRRPSDDAGRDTPPRARRRPTRRVPRSAAG